MTMNFMIVFLLLLGVSCAIPDNKESCRSVVYHVQTLQQVVIIIRQILFGFGTNISILVLYEILLYHKFYARTGIG